MSKKYELIGSEFVFNFRGKKLFRIRALVDIKFYGIKAGDKGGYVESEKNLDLYGDAWVSGDARVSGDAWVSGDARVSGDAWVSGDARVSGNARVYGDARVYGNAWVSGNARVSKFFETVSVTNLKWSLTSLPKGIQVGCKFFSLKEWKENHQQIGQAKGLNTDEAKAYYQLMCSIRRIQRLEAKKLGKKK